MADQVRLFEEDGHDHEEGESTETTAEALASIEREKVGLMEDLARVAEKQKALQREMRRCEREQKGALKEVAEHAVLEGQELTSEDVERWCRSAFFNMAHTMPGNPHCYFARKKVKRPEMYERVVAYVLEHGHTQRYGSADYTVLDVQLNDSRWFLWPMTDDPSKSEVLNLKPDSLRPGGALENPDGREC